MAIKKLKTYLHGDKSTASERALEIAAELGFEEYSIEYEAIYHAIHQHEVTISVELDMKTLKSRVVGARGAGWTLRAPEKKKVVKKTKKKRAKAKNKVVKKMVKKKFMQKLGICSHCGEPCAWTDVCPCCRR